MKNLSYLYIILLFSILACASQKKIVKPPAPGKAVAPSTKTENTISIFHMGLIDYYIIDSTTTSMASAKKIIDAMSSQIKYDIIYDTKSIVTLRYNADGTINNKILYNYSDGALYEYIYNYNEIYYCKIGTYLNEQHSEREAQYLDKIFIKNSAADKIIFGYKCNQITIKDPIINNKILAEVFISRDIPYVNRGFGQIGSVLNGLPLETTMTVQGVKMRTGALIHRNDSSLAKFLEPNLSTSTELDVDAFRNLKESYRAY